MAYNQSQYKSKEELKASIDNMAKELKEYVDDSSWLWNDDIGEILDRGFGFASLFTDALNLYAQAEWILIRKHEPLDEEGSE